mmetsp:Transcript_24519/g.69919  ORF Transcript_24519/g.69919 Transcript_24519/m.69919 type:complete len:485 (-) Transcript_24519:304-1758(-)
MCICGRRWPTIDYFESEEFHHRERFTKQKNHSTVGALVRSLTSTCRTQCSARSAREASENEGPDVCAPREIDTVGCMAGADEGDVAYADLLLGVRLAYLAYFNDRPGSVKDIGTARDATTATIGGMDLALSCWPLSKVLADLGYTVDRLFSHTSVGRNAPYDTQGFIAHNSTDIVLAYRGSTGAIDMMTNLCYSAVPFDPFGDHGKSLGLVRAMLRRLRPRVLAGGRAGRRTRRANRSLGSAHCGFYDAFLSTVKDIREVVLPQLLERRPKRLVIAGHSLGGALAQGALAYVLKTHDFAVSPHRLLMVTCGSPRFGDVHFRTWVRAEVEALRSIGKCEVARLVHECDGVPLLPPGKMKFAHSMPMTFLSHTGELIRESTTRRRPEHFKRYLTDHSAKIYLTRLEGSAPRESARTSKVPSLLAQPLKCTKLQEHTETAGQEKVALLPPPWPERASSTGCMSWVALAASFTDFWRAHRRVLAALAW